MTSIDKTGDQENLLDGTIYAYDPVPNAGVYATIAGRDGQVYIIAFDFEDLAHLHRAATTAFDGVGVDETAEDRTRITEAGLPAITEMLANAEEQP